VEVAGVGNVDLFRLRTVVNSINLDIKYIQLYYIVEIVFIDLAVDSIQAEGTVEGGDVG